MKLITVPFLILLIATQAFSKWVILAEFSWNQEYIAQNLCENRAKPQMKCGGKCQLMKKLASEEKDNSPLQNRTAKSAFQELLFSIVVINEEAFFAGQNEKNCPSFNHPFYSQPFILSIFHPPSA